MSDAGTADRGRDSERRRDNKGMSDAGTTDRGRAGKRRDLNRMADRRKTDRRTDNTGSVGRNHQRRDDGNGRNHQRRGTCAG